MSIDSTVQPADTTAQAFTVTRVTQGFEFGHGSISGSVDDPEMLSLLDHTIKSSPALIIPIDLDDDGKAIDDDGCGDGRRVVTVFTYQKKFRRSLHRPKVFGGAATMTVACKIGMGEAGDAPLNELFKQSIDTLLSYDIDFGAHTDEHATGSSCGCGAIDRAPEAILAALKYEKSIRAVIASLGLNTDSLDEIYKNLRHYVKVISEHPDYSGSDVMNEIVKAARVVKQLGGEHRERRIIINQVEGYTVNQKLMRDVTAGQAQVFAVDFWRLSDIAKGLYGDDAEARQKAILSELVYTLAIAAVLTKGDLPVDMVEAA